MDSTRSVLDGRHSPELSADLLIHGHRLAIAALGPEHIVLRSPRLVAAGEGAIHLKVDSQLTIYHVDLPQGIDPNRREQSYRRLGNRVTPTSAA